MIYIHERTPNFMKRPLPTLKKKQLYCGQYSTQCRSIIFLTKQVEVINTFVLAKLYQYFGDFD